MSLNSFVESYLETAIWSSEEDCEDALLPEGMSILDVSPETRVAVEKECAEFYTHHRLWTDNTDAQAGHDFWLTRNGHGAGFWDGDYENGDALTELAEKYGTVCIYQGDNGSLYID